MPLAFVCGHFLYRKFIEEHRSTIEELYYIRAVETGENAFTFSVPLRTRKCRHRNLKRFCRCRLNTDNKTVGTKLKSSVDQTVVRIYISLSEMN